MNKTILSLVFLIQLSVACNAQEIINDATNSSHKVEAAKLVIDKLKNEELAATAIVINGNVTVSDLRRELIDQNNLLVNVYRLPEILRSYGLDSSTHTVVMIERKELTSNDSLQQRMRYDRLAAQARILLEQKDFNAAVNSFNAAIQFNKNKGLVTDRFLLACAYATTGQPDSAFSQLFRIAQIGNFYQYPKLENESLLQALHSDARWSELLQIVKANAEKSKPQFQY